MSDNPKPTITLEWFLYGLIVLAALGLRLAQLGAHPLNDVEAREALTVLHHVRGVAGAAIEPRSPAYFFFTFFSFLLFGASEATARLGPALAGAGLVLLPALFRDHLTRGGALLASALLAISSSLLAASRSADGALLAVLGLALATGALWRALLLRREGRAGASTWLYAGSVALGLGLAAGGTFWFGAIALALTMLGLRWTQPDSRAWMADVWAWLRSRRRTLPLTVVLSVLLIGTVGLTYLGGLGALVDSWTAWLGRFSPAVAGRPPWLLLIFLLVYEPLVVAFGVFGAVRAFRSRQPLGQALAWFSAIALAELLLYSGRSLLDLVWVTAPLSLLAGYALYSLVADLWSRRELPLAAVQAGISVVLAVFALLNVASFAELVKNSGSALNIYDVNILGQNIAFSPVAQMGVAGLAVALIAVVAYLVSLGWSPRAARLGLLWAVAVLLLSMNVSAAWGLTRLRPGCPAELWWESPASDDVNRLMQTLASVSNYSVGNPRDVQVTVQASPAGLLAWALRDFPHAAFVDRLDPVINSVVVITPSDEKNPTLGSTYVGQRFDLRGTWTPALSLSEWIGWAAYRRATGQKVDPAILWVRQDIQQLKSTGTNSQ
jgi:hypothetical protein